MKAPIAPQAGPQTSFMKTSANICIYGGAAGGGKTYALLMEPLYYKDNPQYNSLILRHEYTQITNPGGLWDASAELYGKIPTARRGKTPKLHWTFLSGANVNFGHITRNEDCESYQGAQICYIGFDELCHFNDYQFFYMLSRNRSTCGVRPYVRATCNPDPDSWVAEFISWWIDQDSGYPIPEKSGVLRWMLRDRGKILWFDTKEEAHEYARDSILLSDEEAKEYYKSVTFIASTLEDNKVLMKADPGYKANLNALPLVERERLLLGNWKIRNKAGLMFKRSQVKVDDWQIRVSDISVLCRGWDLAATTEDENGDAAYTSSVLMARLKNEQLVILDVTNRRLSAGEVLDYIINTAKADKARYGNGYRVRIPQDPGQAGKSQAAAFIKAMQGFDIVARPESGDKVTRAAPVAAQWQHGFIDIQEGEWNNDYFNQLESFPDGKYKDMVDATSSAFDELANYMVFNIDNMI